MVCEPVNLSGMKRLDSSKVLNKFKRAVVSVSSKGDGFCGPLQIKVYQSSRSLHWHTFKSREPGYTMMAQTIETLY